MFSEDEWDVITEESMNQNYARIKKDVPGVLAIALFDGTSGLTRFARSDAPEINFEYVGTLATELMDDAAHALSAWGHSDGSEDAIVTTGHQLHLIRRRAGNDVLVYVIADGFVTNLAMLKSSLDRWE